MKYAEVNEKLSARGTKIGAYHQQSKVASAPDKLRHEIADGFCCGACMDWLRCVLNGAGAGHEPEVSLAGVGSIAQHHAVQDEFFQTFKAKVNQARAEDQRKVNLEIRALNERAQEIIKQQMPALSQEQYDALLGKVAAGVEKRSQAIYDEHRARHQRYDEAMQPDTLYPQFWKEFTKVMDQKLGYRLGNQKYSNLKIAGSSRPQFHGPPNGVVALIDAVLKDKAFTAGNGIFLGIYPGGGGSRGSGGNGHAIAIRRLNTGNFHMFEPNFGTFDYSFDNLRWAFEFLFLEAYPNLEDGTRDRKHYQQNGQVCGEYVIYEGLAAHSVTVNTAGSMTASKALAAAEKS